jgi:transcriptional regulator with PAS, ATPase and Fis domain
MTPQEQKFLTREAQKMRATAIASGMSYDNAKLMMSRYMEQMGIKWAIASDATEHWLEKFITEDSDTKAELLRVRYLADMTQPVMIQAESGCGKEIIANALHSMREGKFVAVNMTAIPETLLESELFGYVAGAFTGALTDRVGLLQSAANGTLFLDELSRMPKTGQAKLLRALETKQIRRVGDTKTIQLPEFRIVSATQQTEEQILLSGDILPDLYWRIATHVIKIKPLRERPDDIDELLCTQFNGEDLRTVLDCDFLAALRALPLHGNVREVLARANRHLLSTTIKQSLTHDVISNEKPCTLVAQ